MKQIENKRIASLAQHLTPSRPMRICDVGANPLSEPPYKPLLDGGLAHVYGFEPNEAAFAELEDAKSDHETYFCEAVGLPGNRTLYLHPASGLTSLYPLDPAALKFLGREKWYRPRRTQEVPLNPVTLDMLPDLPGVDLLKMDLQGGELEVMRGGIGKLSNAVAIVAEVRFHRMYKDEPMFGDLDQEMRLQGFKLHKFLFAKSVMLPHGHGQKVRHNRMRSQLLDGDAVYIRDGNWAEDLSDDQLSYLALAADAAFASPDLTLYCLDLLTARGVISEAATDAYIAELPAYLLRDDPVE